MKQQIKDMFSSEYYTKYYDIAKNGIFFGHEITSLCNCDLLFTIGWIMENRTTMFVENIKTIKEI